MNTLCVQGGKTDFFLYGTKCAAASSDQEVLDPISSDQEEMDEILPPLTWHLSASNTRFYHLRFYHQVPRFYHIEPRFYHRLPTILPPSAQQQTTWNTTSVHNFWPPLLQTDQFKHFANTNSFMEYILSKLRLDTDVLFHKPGRATAYFSVKDVLFQDIGCAIPR